MKKLVVSLMALILTSCLFAQTSSKMSYQAIVRNANGQLVTNQTIKLELAILEGSESGTIIYNEYLSPTTNSNGLVSVEFGGGVGFSNIEWYNNNYYIRSSVDLNNNYDFTIIGVSQILSVPYAFHAKTADTYIGDMPENDPIFLAWNKSYYDLTNIPTEFTPSTHNHAWSTITGKPTTIAGYSITDAFNGSFNNLTNKPTTIAGYGITDAFSGSYNDLTNKPTNATTTTSGFMSNSDKVKLDGLQNANGSETKLQAGTNVTITGTGTTANPYIINSTTSTGTQYYLGQLIDGGVVFYLYVGSDGQQHGLIVSTQQSGSLAWQYTLSLVNANRSWDGAYNTSVITHSSPKTYVTNLGAGWYLPSIDELSLLWHNRFHVNKTLFDNGQALLENVSYWSSTEATLNNAMQISFFNGQIYSDGKPNTYKVRAVRAF
jgi:hypothetical protein